MMKSIVITILAIFLSFNVFSQSTVGEGVALEIITSDVETWDDEGQADFNNWPIMDITFAETSVGDSTEITLILSNSLGITQSVSFEWDSNPDNPLYFISGSSNEDFDFPSTNFSQHYVSLEPNSFDTIFITFAPDQAIYSQNILAWTGSIYGGGAIRLGGIGVQVDVILESDSLGLPNTNIGSSSSTDFELYNSGSGQMILYEVSSSDPNFSISPSDFISDNSVESITITYNGQYSGNQSSVITLHTNDSDEPFQSFIATVSATSNIGGNLCDIDTLYAVNSPYNVTSDIAVNSNCELFIEPGVVLEGNGYDFNSEGITYIQGNDQDSIYFNEFETISINDSTNLEYTSFKSSKLQDFNEDFEGYSLYSYLDSPENYLYVTNSLDKKCLRISNNNSSYDNFYTVSSIVSKENIDISFSVRVYNNSTKTASYRINGGEWTELGTYYNSTSWNNYSYSIQNQAGDLVELKFLIDGSYNTNGEFYIDDIKMNYVDDIEYSISNSKELSNCFIDQKLLFTENDFYYDFDDGEIPQGWNEEDPPNNNSYISLYVSTENSNSFLQFRASQQNYSSYTYTPNYNVTGDEARISFDAKHSSISSVGGYALEYELNNSDNWIELFSPTFNNYGSPNYYDPDYGIIDSEWKNISYYIDVNPGDNIRFRFYVYTNNSMYFEIDNFKLKIGDYNKDINILNCVIKNDVFSDYNTSITGSNLNYDLNLEYFAKNFSCDSSNFNGSIFLENMTNTNLNFSKFNNNVTINGGNTNIYSCTFDSINSLYSLVLSDCENSYLDYSFIINNSGGIFSSSDYLSIENSMISNNSGIGIYNEGDNLYINHSNITYNSGKGIYQNNNIYTNIYNSILWGNDFNDHNQIYAQNSSSNGLTSVWYSNVEAYETYGLNPNDPNEINVGDGVIDSDPLFDDIEQQHLTILSPCVDAANPNHFDTNMPYGLGTPIADMGMYGGGKNGFWGGQEAPDGNPVISSVDDIPQDQGGFVGVLFDKSMWDNYQFVNKITEYSIWRNLDVNGNSISLVSEGNWENIGLVQAQSFDSYGFTSQTIGDSTLVEGMFNSCFIVIAHTDNEDVFYPSNVLCGNSVDNLSPVSTDLIAEQTDPDQVLLAWNPSIDDDFAYSEIFSDFGFSQTNLTDTTTFDLTVEAGETVTYGLIHYDVNGNPSDTSWTTIQLQDDKDYIALKAGWNLISTNVTPDENNISAIMSSLTPGNLIFITGFNNGVSVFDPNGLPFLNTLNQFEDGYGYWVKVNQDDTLIVSGELISHDFIPDFNAGWNLVGYTQGYTQSIETYFDFLLFDDNLIYATSFNQGVSVYDPNGLPFLNTLTTVDDNFGYWVKLNSAYGGSNSMRLSSDGQSYSPNFMLVNGTSNLTSQKGEFIEVLNSNDEVVAKLEILHDGYVMTSALYGDDKLTVDVDGLQQGELLRFKYKNSVIDNGLVFNGDMELRKLNLEFNLTDGVMMYPNPTRGLSNIEFNIVESSDVTIEICDVSGRVISSSLTSYDSEGSYSLELDLQSFDSGAYFVKLIVNNQITYTDRIFKQ